jgi:hypothetical protein
VSVLPSFDVIPEAAKRLSGTPKRQMARVARKLRRR